MFYEASEYWTQQRLSSTTVRVLIHVPDQFYLFYFGAIASMSSVDCSARSTERGSKRSGVHTLRGLYININVLNGRCSDQHRIFMG